MLLFALAPLPPVSVESGELPILISAPHGGRGRIANVPDRTTKGAATVADAGTAELSRALAEEIGRRIGKRPYLVVSNITRKQFDANRSERGGVECEGAKPAYRAYHGAVTRFRAEILGKWGKGLLLDLHGHGRTPGAIYRGTANGATVAGLSREALVGPEGLLGALEARGVQVIPAGTKEGTKEDPAFNGGFIVREHGTGRFWAVQLEFGIDFRRRSAIPKTATLLGGAVERFARAELSER